MNIEKSLSQRVLDIDASASMSINEKVATLQQQGRKIINLSIGEPDFDTPHLIKEAAIKALNDNFTHYTSSKGIMPLRQAISQKLEKENGLHFDPEKNIVVTPGVKQGLYYLNCSLINPGDEAVILEPYWLGYTESLKLCGGVPVTVPGDEKNGFKTTAEEIEQKISPRTKYILFSNPCNPSGALWTREELEKIVSIAQKNNLFIISDEIYEKIIFDSHSFTSTAAIPGAEALTITLNGLSKSVAMTGWRVGYIAAQEAIVKAVNKVQQQIATCVSSLSQAASIAAFTQEEEIKEMVAIYEKRRDLLVNGLNAIPGIKCIKPYGTFYAFPNISGLGMNSIEATEYFLNKADVAVVPGIAYGTSCDNYVRFSFAASEKKINKAIKNIESALRQAY